MTVETLYWKNNCLHILDQRRLPKEKIYIICSNYSDVVDCIKDMAIRGAPAIGVAAAWGIALAAGRRKFSSPKKIGEYLNKICVDFANSRPTAVNLFWAIERMKLCARKLKDKSLAAIQQGLLEEAQNIHNTLSEIKIKISEFDQELEKLKLNYNKNKTIINDLKIKYNNYNNCLSLNI